MNKRLLTTAIVVLVVSGVFFLSLTSYRKGKTQYDVVIFGDSRMTMSYTMKPVAEWLKEMSDRSVLNASFGGTTMAEYHAGNVYASKDFAFFSMLRLSEALRDRDFSFTAMSTQKEHNNAFEYFEENAVSLLDTDWTKVKYIVIAHGINDYMQGIEIDDENRPFSRETFGGALRNTIENVRKGAPNCKIILITPVYCYLYNSADAEVYDFGGGLLKDYVDKEIEIASEYGVYVVDSFRTSGINSTNYKDYTIVDGLHLNDEGSRLVALQLENMLDSFEP